VVSQVLHEHAATLSAAGPTIRSRRLIKCAKDSGQHPGFRLRLQSEGARPAVDDYTSENTTRLDVDGVIALLRQIRDIRERLGEREREG